MRETFLSDEQVEREILGSCFGEDVTKLLEVRSFLDVTEFATERHRIIFRAMCDLADEGTALTWNAVFRYLEARRLEGSVGGIGYLVELKPMDFALQSNLKRAKNLATRRRLTVWAQNLGVQACDTTLSLEEILEDQRKKLDEAMEDPVPLADSDVQSIITAAGGIEALLAEKKGIPSPWFTLDHYTNGWQAGDLVIVAARPSMGKTAFALNVIWHAAEHGHPAVFYSYEMRQESVLRRLISIVARIPYQDLGRGNLNSDERRRVTDALYKLTLAPLLIVDATGLTGIRLRSHAEKLKRRGKLAIAAVDYIGLMPVSREENRNQELGEVCRQMKELAGHLEIPLLLLSQLNRAVEGRADKKPQLSDLRDSGELENHADLVALLHRPGYYHRDDPSLRLIAECAIAKHRNGDTPTIPLIFRGEYGRFEAEATEVEP